MTEFRSDTAYYTYFDFLRILLAAVVMLGHDNIIPGRYSGHFAVEVFFALSGFLIGGILLNSNYSLFSRFYFNRAMRIWVPYYIALALLVIASLMRDPITAKWMEFVLYDFTFVYNLFGPPQLAEFASSMPLQGTGNHFWSVNAEEQFYLIAPILLVFMPASIGKHVGTWVLIAAIAWWFDFYASISFGVLMAVLIYRYGAFHLSYTAKALSLVFICVMVGLLLAGAGYYMVAPFLAVAIVFLLAIPGKQSHLGKFLGGMSYPLYLNHWIGVFAGNALLGPFGLKETVVRHVLSIIISLAVAAVLYWYVDRKLLELRGQLYSEFRGALAKYGGYTLVAVGISGALILEAQG